MKSKEEVAEYYKEYYKENKYRFKELHAIWMKKNKLRWNKYQAWCSRVRYWEKKLELDPTNEAFITKLNKTYEERPD
jgi:hypothetical protein